MSYTSKNQNFLGKFWRKRENKLFFKHEKKILTLNHYEQVIVSCSVAVMYKLSRYVIPLCEPNTGLIDLNMLYFCITVICYLFTFGMIWETS